MCAAWGQRRITNYLIRKDRILALPVNARFGLYRPRVLLRFSTTKSGGKHPLSLFGPKLEIEFLQQGANLGIYL